MMRRIFVNASLVVGLLGFATMNIGCSRAQVICDLRCECEHCNNQDELVECDQLAAQEDVADAYDCSDAWNDLTVCMEEKGTCDETEARFTTRDSNGDNRCETEERALADCIDDASAHGGIGNF